VGVRDVFVSRLRQVDVAGSTGRTPRIRDIVFALVALVVLLFAFINLGVVVKLVGAGLMVIPSTLGIVQRVSPQEVFSFDLSKSPTDVGIGRPGRYAVYAYDYDLLMMSDQHEQSGGAPWITLKSQVTGEAVPVTFVSRGMRAYDTPLAKGRPVLSFVIDRPGVYVMLHPAKPVTISIVRDYVTGKERMLTLAFLAQIAVVVIPLMFLYTRRYLIRRSARRTAQRQRRAESDAFWGEQAQKNQTWRKPK
jgi:hypothetical protein